MTQLELVPKAKSATPALMVKKTKEAVVVTRKAEVLVPATLRITKAGSPICGYIVKCLDGELETIGCTSFNETAEQAAKLRVGDKITITGKPDERNEEKLVVWGVHKAGTHSTVRDLKSSLAQEYGSLEKYEAARAKRRQTMLEAGMVPVKSEDGFTRYELAEDCIHHNGRWMIKIDYLMEVLGAKVVRGELRAITKTAEIDVTPDKKTGFSKPSASWVLKFKDWLNRRIAEVRGEPTQELFPDETKTEGDWLP